MDKKKIQLTPDGAKKLKEELNELKTVKAIQAQSDLERERLAGDLSENEGYELALDTCRTISMRISEIDNLLKSAEIVEKEDDGIIGFGDKVTVTTPQGEQVYEIVDETSANPLEKKITPESPIGQALMNKKVGEDVKINLPAGEVTFTVKEIS